MNVFQGISRNFYNSCFLEHQWAATSDFTKVNKCKFSCHNELPDVAQRCSVKNVFLKIWQNSQENICVGVSFLIKLQAEGLFYRTPLVAASVPVQMDWVL